MPKEKSHEKPPAQISTALVGAEKCIEEIFPDQETRPKVTTFTKWRKKGFIPSISMGRRIYFNPSKVQKALEERFTTQAKATD